MEKPVYALEFEKPLRDLDRQLEQLHQLSIENNVDVSSEIAAIERKIEATKRARSDVARAIRSRWFAFAPRALRALRSMTASTPSGSKR